MEKRIEIFQEFQKKKVLGEAKQSAFFRDNYRIRNALKEIHCLCLQNKQNKTMFVSTWRVAIEFICLLQKLSCKITQLKYDFKGQKIIIKTIKFFFHLMKNFQLVVKAKNDFQKKLLISPLLEIKDFVAKSSVNVSSKIIIFRFLKIILIKLRFQKYVTEFGDLCNLIRQKIDPIN